MKPAVLFDLGNTLAAYYHADQFEPILRAAVGEVLSELEALALSEVDPDAAFAAAKTENREAPDYRFTPMAGRFERIFGVSLAKNDELSIRLCEIFLRPIFAVGRVYSDTLPAIDRLRRIGIPIAIVSNMPWGSPPSLWRKELERLGLASVVDSIVLCGDVGWRKPAAEIFEFAAATLDHGPEDCIFVGDDLRWDIAGSAAVGMRPVLIDRDRRNREYAGERVEKLDDLVDMLETGT
jgi:putative hydrolase of the HAD superfamily